MDVSALDGKRRVKFCVGIEERVYALHDFVEG